MTDEERIEKVLYIMAGSPSVVWHTASILKTHLDDPEPDAWFRIEKRMISEGLVEKLEDDSIELTDKGIELATSYQAYYFKTQKQKEKDQRIERETKELQHRKLKWDLSTRYISIAAIIISLVSRYIAVLSYFKK